MTPESHEGEPHEAGWRALAAQVAGEAEPAELTDRRILAEAGRIAAEQRAAQVQARAQTRARRRWVPGAMAASLALVALGFGYALGPGRLGGIGPDAGSDPVVPADAGLVASAPAVPQVEVALQFAPGGAALSPADRIQLATALSQIDPCEADVRLRLDVRRGDASAEARAAAVAAALRSLAGDRCPVRVTPAPGGRDLAGGSAVLVLAHGAGR